MKALILYFFLLILEIPLNFSPDIGYKQDRFSKALLKKSYEFVLNKKDGFIAFNLGFVLLLAKINSILEKQSYKKNLLMACDTSCVKMILTLLKKIITLYMQASII